MTLRSLETSGRNRCKPIADNISEAGDELTNRPCSLGEKPISRLFQAASESKPNLPLSGLCRLYRLLRSSSEYLESNSFRASRRGRQIRIGVCCPDQQFQGGFETACTFPLTI